MPTYNLHRTLWLPRPLPVVFDFFAKAENLAAITPQWLQFQLLTPLPMAMKEDAHLSYSLRVRGFPIEWLTRIERWNPPSEFIDVQEKGPYAFWRHTHRFTESSGGTMIEDLVEYALPFGLLGRLAHRLVVARDLSAIFDYRARQVQALLV
jgi:ligand-binding SRPBCC domain-containing protein